MTIEYKLPDLGEDIETGDVIDVFVSAGDSVTEDQALLEIETDKAAVEIPSPSGGKIKEVHVNQGDTVKVGQLLVTIDDGEADDETVDEDLEDEGVEVESNTESEEKSRTKKEDEEIEKTAEKEAEEEMRADPEPKKESETKENQKASGDDKKSSSNKGGKKDIDPDYKKSDNNLESESDEKVKKKKADREEIEQDDDSDVDREDSGDIVPASPSVRRVARELDVDIKSIEGSGPGGRILEEDVRNASETKNKDKSDIEKKSNKTTKEKTEGTTDNDKWGEIEHTPMSKVRKLTAERLTEAWKAPHVTQHDKADITDLEKLRKEFGKTVAEAGGKLTMTSILVKVIASALKAFPQFNASVDMENKEIIFKKYYNIGVAVDTDRGLLVPVIKDANKKNITKLSVELSELSEKARTKKISVDEFQGGTFTISNLGGIGGTYFSPVLNAPEVAILGISRSVIEPVYKDGGFLPRLMLPLSLSYDHRLIDGADAIRFLRWIIEALEEPFKLPMEG